MSRQDDAEHRPGQDDVLYQIQPYYDDIPYSYRGNANSQDDYRWQSSAYAADVQANRYDNPHTQYHYQTNGYDYGAQFYPAWGASYPENGYEVPYPHSGYYDASLEYQYSTWPARFYQRPPRTENAITPTSTTPRSPSPSYLSATLTPSVRTETPTRKLLILDLNGTLLFRPKPPVVARPPPPAGSPRPQAPAPFQPLKRTVHMRPYLICFQKYLFHPSTEEWLDVMIWSSAQPHSVRDMLQRCFPVPEKEQDGDREETSSGKNTSDERFIAVWARDTLGLSSVDYSRKAQTTKDLQKPWSQLPYDAEERHSARTTLLLDDSPRKAHLQPWNHVCLREYDAGARDEDVRALGKLQPKGGKGDQDESDTPATDVVGASRPSDQTPAAVTTLSATTEPAFDPTLFAVIGVLEAIKRESNVAGWIRAGGLWAGQHTNEMRTSAATAESADSPTASASSIKRARDGDEDNVQESSKRARLDSPPRTAPSPPGTPPPSSQATMPPPTPPCPLSPARRGNDREDAAQPLWFAHAPTFERWVKRGRETLVRLGIEEVHGVIGGE